MLLYITRHGKAQPESPTGRDEDRPLRRRGERQAAWLAEELGGDGARAPSLILTSARARALATATIVGESVGCELRIEPRLDLGHAVGDVLEAIEEASRVEGANPLMLVGHNPQLESLVGALSSGPASAVRMRTGECAVIRGSEVGASELVEMLRLVD